LTQYADAARIRKSITLLQLDDAVFGGLGRGFGQEGLIEAAAADRLDRPAKLFGKEGLLAGFTDIAQHRPGFDGGQLILVAQENHPRLRTQRLEQFGHEGQIHHRGFVDHHHLDRQRIVCMVTKVWRALNGPEQPMNGRGCFRDGLPDRFRAGQLRFRRLDGLLQARCGFSRRSRQGDPQVG